MRIVTAPVELLRDVHVVDTPGTNAIIREHERITADFVPRSDLVLFVTSADRPFTETERAFLEQVRGWGKKVVIVINKIDILEDEQQVADVRTSTMHGKFKRQGKFIGQRSDWKKAFVRLREGEKVPEFLEGA